ncbi:MAG: glycoside hydrolase family 2 protein [Proteobacteria bacterium]|nr:glycoside hydrolase family 2 protein [Pseudomonadota bacterium]
MKTLDLNGEWRMKGTTEETWIPAIVPGSVYGDLLAAGKIADPFYRDNEIEIKKLSEYDYEYDREFLVDDDLYNSDRLVLSCEGLDTLAEIEINGNLVAKTNNMHRSYEFDIKNVIKKGENHICLVFRSPLEYITRKNEENPLWGTPDAVAGISHLRKAHYMFGWDWGPTLPDMGIWRHIGIKGFDSARLDDVYVSQDHEGKSVLLDVRVRQKRWMDDPTEISVEISSPTQEKIECSLSTKNQEEHIRIAIDNPELWWPNGYGDQPLYQAKVVLKKDGLILDSRSFRIGLRTLTVKQEEDAWGKSFEFEINGLSIFAMGANYIPEDNLLSRCDRSKTERLIADCVAANFNCIRIWGGGFYPEDYFFDLCDEYGLVVWQDLMFACAVYDITDEFADNIKKEAEDNIKRIRHHASLGLWCGNNEMEWAWVEWQLPKSEKLRTDYLKQFETILLEAAGETDPETFYWPASPSSGGGFDKPNDENFGDVHDWTVWHGRQPFTYYRQHFYRFLSEFGLQSFPSLETVESCTLPKDRNIFSHIMEHHQKNGTGNGTILHYISQNFKYPKNFDSLLYASQLIQAQGMKYAVEHMRRHRGRCMGAVYWQLNDCWPVASWSSIDSAGRWKALHYFARRFFRPILLSACEDGTKVSLHLTNDTRESISGTVEWRLRDNCSGILKAGKKDVSIDTLCAEQCEDLDFREILDTIEKQRETYLEYDLTANDGIVSSESILFVKPKHFDYLKPSIAIEVRRQGEKTVVSLVSDVFAEYVEVSIKGMDVVFSDNYFHLSASVVKEIEIMEGNLLETVSPEELGEKLSVRSIFDMEER